MGDVPGDVIVWSEGSHSAQLHSLVSWGRHHLLREALAGSVPTPVWLFTELHSWEETAHTLPPQARLALSLYAGV